MFDPSSLTPKGVASDCRGKQDNKVLSTEIGSRLLRPDGVMSNVFFVELLLLKSDHSLSSSDGPRSSLPAMLCFETNRVRLDLVTKDYHKTPREDSAE